MGGRPLPVLRPALLRSKEGGHRAASGQSLPEGGRIPERGGGMPAPASGPGGEEQGRAGSCWVGREPLAIAQLPLLSWGPPCTASGLLPASDLHLGGWEGRLCPEAQCGWWGQKRLETRQAASEVSTGLQGALHCWVPSLGPAGAAPGGMCNQLLGRGSCGVQRGSSPRPHDPRRKRHLDEARVWSPSQEPSASWS
ncbi:hypothetical protein H8959_021431 [Pygathrix nigripes]